MPRPFATLITIILGYIDAIISIFNNYTISLAGITGENFFSAAKSATKIFRRNLLSGLFGGKFCIYFMREFLLTCYRSFNATYHLYWYSCDCFIIWVRCLYLCNT